MVNPSRWFVINRHRKPSCPSVRPSIRPCTSRFWLATRFWQGGKRKRARVSFWKQLFHHNDFFSLNHFTNFAAEMSENQRVRPLSEEEKTRRRERERERRRNLSEELHKDNNYWGRISQRRTEKMNSKDNGLYWGRISSQRRTEKTRPKDYGYWGRISRRMELTY